MTSTLDSILDSLNTMLCIYIIGVVCVRLTMMSWKTHRKVWQVIYACAGVSAASYFYVMVENIPHLTSPPFFCFLYTALWFIESRNRWTHKPPDYMRN